MAPTCHQKSDRSFFYHGWQFPVCARCTGLYLGYLLGLLLLIAQLQLPLLLCLCLMLLMWLDWYIQYRNIKASTNRRRCLSGLAAGCAMIHLLAYGIQFFL